MKDKIATKPSYDELQQRVKELETLLRQKGTTSATDDTEATTKILKDQIHFQKTLFFHKT